MSSVQRRAAIGSSSATRQRLVEAAAALIDRHGMPAATSRAITEHAGENLGSITYYFGSKAELIGEALTLTAHELIAPVTATLSGPGDPITNMLRAVQQLTELLDDERTRLAGYTEALAAAARDDPLGRGLRVLFRELKGLLADSISSRRTAGFVPNWVDPVTMADLIVALANGVAINTALDPASTNPAAIGRQFAALLLTVARPDNEPGVEQA